MDKAKTQGIRFVERSLLGTIVLKPSLYINNEKILSFALFSSEKNRKLFKIITDLYSKAEEIDYNLLSNRVAQDIGIDYKTLDSNYLAMADSSKFNDYLSEVVEYSKKSTLSKAITEAKDGLLADEPSDIIKAKLMTSLQDNEINDAQTFHVSEYIKDTMDSVYKAMKSNGLSGITTGITKLNERNGGWQGGDVTIIAARAGLGKTTMAMNLALTAAREGNPVSVFSLEMGGEQLLLLLAEIITGVETEDIRGGRINQDQVKAIEEAMTEVTKLPLFLIGGARPIEEIITKIRFLNKRVNLKMVLVDYLQLIQSGKRMNNRNAEVEHVSRQLKLIAMPNECNLSMIVLSQLNRGLESRADKRPMLSDLRDSGAIEQDADMVLMLYRENYYDHECTDNTTELEVMKNRFGKTGVIRLTYVSRKYVDWEGDINQNYDPDRYTDKEDIPF